MRGIAERPVHRWRPKYGGMSVHGLKRLKVENLRENLRLKRMAADPDLDHADARGRHRNARKALTPAAKRKAAGRLRKARPASGLAASRKGACRIRSRLGPRGAAQGAAAASGPDGRADPTERPLVGRLHGPASWPTAGASASAPRPPARRCAFGAGGPARRWTSSSPASPPRTLSWRASTASSGTAA